MHFKRKENATNSRRREPEFPLRMDVNKFRTKWKNSKDKYVPAFRQSLDCQLI